jgi:hypothetical protein
MSKSKAANFLATVANGSFHANLTQVAKKHLSFCNSIFSIFLNQIKAQKGQKIIV